MTMTTKTLSEIDAVFEEHLSNLKPTPFGAPARELFSFDKSWRNLNHGSFGATPTTLTALASHLRQISEQRPDHYIRVLRHALLTRSRSSLPPLLHAPLSSLVLVANATSGVNTVLRNFRFEEGDRIAYFSFIYGACGNTVEYICETTPAKPLLIQVSLPVSDGDIVDALDTAVKKVQEEGGRVKVAVFDLVTSMPAARIPWERLVAKCKEHGVMSLVDAAHGVGMLDVNLEKSQPDFFVSNLHKWLFVPRGCAVLYVAPHLQHLIRSTIPTSWGFVPAGREIAREENKEGSWASMFDDVGTSETSNYLLVGAAVRFREVVFGGEKKIWDYLIKLADFAELEFKKGLGGVETFGGGSAMRNFKLPLEKEEVEAKGGDWKGVGSWLQRWFLEERETFVAVFEYEGSWWGRVSAQVYLDEEDMKWGVGVVREGVEKVKSGEWVGVVF